MRGRNPLSDKKAPIGFKWCSLCGEVKHLDEFDKERKPRGPSRKLVLMPYDWCKTCRASARRRQYAKRKKS